MLWIFLLSRLLRSAFCWKLFSIISLLILLFISFWVFLQSILTVLIIRKHVSNFFINYFIDTTQSFVYGWRQAWRQAWNVTMYIRPSNYKYKFVYIHTLCKGGRITHYDLIPFVTYCHSNQDPCPLLHNIFNEHLLIQ